VTAFNSFVLNFVVNAIWQVAVVAALAALGNWLLSHVASARQRHFVWVAALVLSVALPLWSALPLPRSTLSLPQFAAPIAALPIAVLNAGTLAQTSPAPATPQQAGNRSRWRDLPFGKIIVGLYLLFLLYRVARLGRAWRLTTAIRQGAFPVAASTALEEALAHCRTTLGLNKVALFGSPSVAVPVTLGLGQPIIILPESLIAETSVDLLRAALGHELAHIQRRDFAWNLFYELLFLPISFHPAAVLVKRRINETRELACDETVSELLLDAQVYARSLVSLANSSSLPTHPTYILGVNDANILEERVMKLLAKKPFANTRRTTVLLGITLFTLAMAGAGAATLPLNIQPEKGSQNQNNNAAATRFVGRWKGFVESNPNNRTHEIIFTLEGEKLVGSMSVGNNEFKPLPPLKVSERDVSWKEKDPNHPKLVLVTQVRLISEDEILFEAINPFDYYGGKGEERLLEVHPTTWTLNRQK
jgi:beta-lactamase regulating signal transducer with metallopeptidase domain